MFFEIILRFFFRLESNFRLETTPPGSWFEKVRTLNQNFTYTALIELVVSNDDLFQLDLAAEPESISQGFAPTIFTRRSTIKLISKDSFQ